MKKIFLSTITAFTLTTFLTLETKAQTSGVNAHTNVNEAINGKVSKALDNRYAGVTGSPYWFKQWLPGEVKFQDTSLRLEKGPIKYDPFSSVVLLKSSSKDSTVFDGNTIEEFTLFSNDGTGNLKFRRFPNLKFEDTNLKNTFFQVLQEGNTLVLKNIKKSLVRADFKGGYSANRTTDEITSENQYFLLKPDQTLIKVKLNRKGMMNALADKESSVTEFVKKEKLSLQSEEDLKKVVAFYNSI